MEVETSFASRPILHVVTLAVAPSSMRLLSQPSSPDATSVVFNLAVLQLLLLPLLLLLLSIGPLHCQGPSFELAGSSHPTIQLRHQPHCSSAAHSSYALGMHGQKGSG